MSHKNYHNYSKPFKAPDVQEQNVPTSTTPVVETTEPEIDASVPNPEATIEPPIVETTEEPTEESAPELPKSVTGVVSGCKKLNVRTRPNITAGIICAINEGTEVEIAQPVVNGDFYKVTLPTGAVGYCMKKFITVK